MPMRKPAIALCSFLATAVLGTVSCAPIGPAPVNPRSDPLNTAELVSNETRSFVDPPVRGMTLTTGQKDKYLNAKRMSAVVRQRCVKGQYEKNVRCNESIPVRITAVEGAKLVGDDEAPRYPQLLAWIENLSSLYTTFDEIKPGVQARYALVAMPTMSETTPRGGTKRPDLVLVEFDHNWTLVEAHPWSHIFPCHKYRQPFRSEADFRPCTLDPHGALTKIASRHSGIMFASLSAPTAFIFYADDPIWFSCSGGCCTSGNHGVEPY